MGPSWDPLVQHFQYDFNISFKQCSNHSLLNEYESEYYDYILMRFGLMYIWDILIWEPLGAHLESLFFYSCLLS